MVAELNGMKQSALRKRCVEAGMDEEALEDCDDADDTKVSHGNDHMCTAPDLFNVLS